jgi:hypothetical protein
MKVGVIIFLILRSGSCLLSEELTVRNQHQGGVSFDDNCLAKRMKEAFDVTCETKMARIYGNQDSRRCTWSEQGTYQSS